MAPSGFDPIFLPMNAPVGWTAEKDLNEFEARFDATDNLRRDVEYILKRNLADLKAVIDAGIHYYRRKRGFEDDGLASGLSLRQKVIVFTNVLPECGDRHYLLRFTAALAKILWFDSEHARLVANAAQQKWLYPFYELADCYASAAFDLDEALSCEHHDYKRPSE